MNSRAGASRRGRRGSSSSLRAKPYSANACRERSPSIQPSSGVSSPSSEPPRSLSPPNSVERGSSRSFITSPHLGDPSSPGKQSPQSPKLISTTLPAPSDERWIIGPSFPSLVQKLREIDAGPREIEHFVCIPVSGSTESNSHIPR